jgi:hypothetical protein
MGLWKLERLDPFVYISVTLAALTFSTGAMCRISPMQGTSNRNLHADFVAGHENGPRAEPYRTASRLSKPRCTSDAV